MTDLALFDLLSPLLSLIDDALSRSLALAAVWRIALFAALASAISMLLFKKLSNQAELAALNQEIKAVQKELARSEMKEGRL